MSQVIKAQWEIPQATYEFLSGANLRKGGKVQKAVDSAVVRYCLPYCPWKTGALARSPFAASHIGEGEVVYDTPYARRMYYNPQYHFRKDVNPMAGAYWFERMKADHTNDILEEAMRVAFD